MTRIRRVDDRQEMELLVDEFITRGYRVQSRGRRQTVLRENDWGDGGVHLILFALVGWWNLGIANGVYAWYRRSNAEEVQITTEAAPPAEASPRQRAGDGLHP